MTPRILLLLLPAALAAGAQAQQGDGTRVPISTHVFKPAKVEPTPERIAALRAPPGFTVSVFASGLKNLRVLAAGSDGAVYATRRDQGDVILLVDRNGDGKADGPPRIVANRPGAHGLALRDGKLYLVTVKELFVATLQPDGSLGPMKMLVGDLPDAGQHANRTIAFGPDGMLYLSVGSTCNACNESNPENATILRLSPDGKQRTIFAGGLRNTIGFDWHPRTGELWGMDHGIDFLGDRIQPEELNRIERGRRYGWPHVWGRGIDGGQGPGQGGENPQSTPVGDITKAQWNALSTPMVLGYAAHAAPMQMLFYRGGSFPAEYLGDAFVTMRGSWNRDPASGYEVVRIRFDQGRPVAFEPFVTGFLTDGGTTHIARPMGLAMAQDGALLMGDDANGTIYRIAYRGSERTAAKAPETPADRMREQSGEGRPQPLAFDRVQATGQARLGLESPAFQDGGALPKRFSDYADGVSPPLAWTPLPEARSYVLLVEDPDAKPLTPFVHWLAWNIPPGVTHLPEGLQEQPRLTEPDGMLQGAGSRGSPGWYGPHPPVGDPPHAYHFQLFALDRMLDLPPGAEREAVLAAMRGHVLAKARLVGRYGQADAPPK